MWKKNILSGANVNGIDVYESGYQNIKLCDKVKG